MHNCTYDHQHAAISALHILPAVTQWLSALYLVHFTIPYFTNNRWVCCVSGWDNANFPLKESTFFILWSVCRYHIEKQSLGLLCAPKVTRSAAIDDKLFDAPLSVGGISSPIEYNLDLDHNQTLTQTQIQVSTLTWPGSRLQFRLRFGQGCRAFQFQSRSIGSDIMANSFFVFFGELDTDDKMIDSL